MTAKINSMKRKAVALFVLPLLILSFVMQPAIASALSVTDLPTVAGTNTSIGNVPWADPNNILTPGTFASGESAYDFTKLDNPAVLPAGSANDAVFSPDGSLMAVAHSSAPFLTIYQVNGTTLTKLPDPAVLPPSTGNGATFSQDGSMLAVAHATSPFFTVYSISGTTFTKLANPAVLPPSTGNGVAFSPDSSMLTVAHSLTPFVSNYSISGTTLTKLPNPAVLPTNSSNGASYSTDGSLMAVAHATSPFVTIYQVTGTTFTKLANPGTLPTGTGDDAKFNPDGSLLAVSHINSPLITVYQISGTTFTKLPDPSALPPGSFGNGIAFSPDGSLLTVSTLSSPYVTTYEVKGTTLTKLPDLATPPLGAGWDANYSADGSLLAVASSNTPFVNVYSVDHRTVTNYLTASGYGLNVPANAKIDGIEVSIEKNKSAPSDDITDNEVRLTPGGTPTGANRAATSQWPDTAATTVYGSPTDTWGLSLTPQDVNDPSFGAALSANVASEAQVSAMSITVHYSLPGDSTTSGGGLADTGQNTGTLVVLAGLLITTSLGVLFRRKILSTFRR